MSAHLHSDQYRRILNSSVRLRELRVLGAPEIMIRNEYRVFNDALAALPHAENRGQTFVVRASYAESRANAS
ncbi:MAG: hypothetical protein ACR2OV_01700 [Hyphomicrobiaceae bacterium]